MSARASCQKSFATHGYYTGVTTVYPGAIKTDMIQATLSHSDDLESAQRNHEFAHRIGVTPEHVAERIIKAVKGNKLRIRVGMDAVLLDILKRWFPTGIQKLLRKVAWAILC